MRPTSATAKAIESCYDAAIDSALWPRALQQLGESLGAQSCTLGTWNADSDPFTLPRSNGHEAFAALWLERVADAPDPHIDRGRRKAQTNRAFLLEQDIVVDDERRYLPYYSQIAARGDRHWWAAICFAVGNRRWSLPLYRGERFGAFSAAEARAATVVAPHLSRIVRLAEQLADERLRRAAGLLDRFRCAAMIVDDRGRALHTNDAADTLLATRLDLHGGRLVTRDGDLVCDIAASLADIAPERPINTDSFTHVFRQHGHSRLMVEIEPASRIAATWFTGGRALVTISEIAAPLLLRADQLRAIFGLTPAEAALAVRIADGEGVQQSAELLSISVETARSQLKSVFAKTGTSRQAQLAGLLAGLSARRW